MPAEQTSREQLIEMKLILERELMEEFYIRDSDEFNDWLLFAAGVAVVYGLFVGIVIYREIKLKELIKVLTDASVSSAIIMFILACAGLWIIICPEGVPVYFAHDSLAAFHAGNGPLSLETRVIPPHLYTTDPAVPAADYLRSIQAKSIGVAGTAGLSARFILSLNRQIGHTVQDMSMELARLRMIKSPAEIEMSRAAVRLNEEAMWAYLKEARPGELESNALAKGYAFAIGSGGDDSSRQHGGPGGGRRRSKPGQRRLGYSPKHPGACRADRPRSGLGCLEIPSISADNTEVIVPGMRFNLIPVL